MCFLHIVPKRLSLFVNEAIIGVDYVYTRFAYYIIICEVVSCQAENKPYCVYITLQTRSNLPTMNKIYLNF